MKIFKRIMLGLILMMFFGFIFRGSIYRTFITYKSLGNRANYEVIDVKLAELIDREIEDKNISEIDKVIETGLNITSKQLTYTADKNENDPNKLIETGNSHCVGYASFFASTCNYTLKKKGLSNEWIALPKIGQLYFLDRNIHNYFYTPFFKDHDFVIIKNKKGGKSLAVDPTIHDYLYIDYVEMKE